ncbi:hypothetical protein EUGRSUZ_E04262 [Eucalyptus grandis]|uniref:Uncharacterized protein n=2 Tax=Eucalyptus grandis TaxID=71139 RepID=A0ACC3L1A2_EUCGR|nr:hypothetical protein EUGRSUZ_E04262 [Eucalyptus grandis]
MKFPPPLSALPIVASTSRRPRLAIASTAQVPPTALTSLFVGISLAPLLVGPVTFVIGPILMPLGRPHGFVLLHSEHGVRSVGVGSVALMVSFFYTARMVSAMSELAQVTRNPLDSSNRFFLI